MISLILRPDFLIIFHSISKMVLQSKGKKGRKGERETGDGRREMVGARRAVPSWPNFVRQGGRRKGDAYALCGVTCFRGAAGFSEKSLRDACIVAVISDSRAGSNFANAAPVHNLKKETGRCCSQRHYQVHIVIKERIIP